MNQPGNARRALCIGQVRIGDDNDADNADDNSHDDTGNDDYNVVANNVNLVRTDADIREAVNAVCSDREQAERIYGPISQWNTNAVTDMKDLFREKKDFNSDISQWDVRNVTNMSCMFYGASSFNQPLEQWDVKHYHIHI